MKKTKYDQFQVRYFSPYKKYYISDGRENYVSPMGYIGDVYYYSSKKSASDTLKKLKKG